MLVLFGEGVVRCVLLEEEVVIECCESCVAVGRCCEVCVVRKGCCYVCELL